MRKKEKIWDTRQSIEYRVPYKHKQHNDVKLMGKKCPKPLK